MINFKRFWCDWAMAFIPTVLILLMVFLFIIYPNERTLLSQYNEVNEIYRELNASTFRFGLIMTVLVSVFVAQVYEVDLATKLIYVNCGKGNKSRVVPITERLHMVLEDYLQYENKRKPSEYFFSTNRYHTISPDYINKCIRFASEDIGLPFKPTAHILRHSFASALVSRNASLPSVQKILGHADLRITSRYIHQDIDALKEAVNLLP